MKIGKDTILGLTQAVEDRLKMGAETGESMKGRLTPFIEALNQIDGLTASVVQDGAGRDIYRASVKIEKGSAKAVIAALKAEDPAIYTREYQANNGIIEFDIRAVDEEEMAKIVSRLKEIL
jgi:L-seryl-tRNA(Ser) seleniumtransferase